jgi:hypothetical protein
MRRQKIFGILGAVLGAMLVLSAMTSSHPGWGFFSHTDCRVNQRLGNITVWVPSAIVAAPYHGSVTGFVVVWGKTPGGNLSVSLNYTPVTDGNVTAFIVGFENWTVVSLQNVSMAGPGPQAACLSSLVAYFSPSPALGERHGGTTSWPMYSQLVSDTGLPTGLNGSQLCAQIENTSYLSCAVGAQFDPNFHVASGTVDTCGSTGEQVVRISSQEWPVTAPFRWNGHSHLVPLDPSGANSQSYANGTYAWYNYSFPANGGVWQYDNLAETSSTGAGLVFSYAPCP